MPFKLEMKERYPKSNRQYRSLRPPPPHVGTHKRNKVIDPEEQNMSHVDQVHEVSYNHFGNRLATCSADLWVRIWDRDACQRWQCNAAWKAHDGPILRVSWAHPEFRSVIATCSADRTACIWEETSATWDSLGAMDEARCKQEDNLVRFASNWIKRATIHSSASITDFRFVPHIYGLACGMTSEDGYIRIYGALELSSLEHWVSCAEINLGVRLSSLSWCQSIYRSKCPLFAVASNDVDYRGDDSMVKFYEFAEYSREWMPITNHQWGGVHDIVRDVRFQSNIARKNDLVAIVTREYLMLVRIQILGEDRKQLYVPGIFDDNQERAYDIHTVAIIRNTVASLWRAAWNIDGKVLVVSTEEGVARCYHCMRRGLWVCYAICRPGPEIRSLQHELYLKMTTEEAIEVVPGMFD